MRLFLILLILSNTAYAGKIFKYDEIDASKQVKHSKLCLERTPANHKANFVKSELCSYGLKGCTGISSKKPFEVLCSLKRVSNCYTKKSWLTRNQYFGLSDKLTVSNISHTTNIVNGKISYEICAYYK